MSIVSVVETCVNHLDVVLGDLRLLGELLSQEILNESDIAVEEPAYDTESKHVSTLHDGLVVHAGVGKTILHHLCDRTSHYSILIDAHLCEIVGCLEFCLLQILGTEAVGVDDDCSLWFSMLVLCLQCSGVHSHQHIALVTRGINLSLTDVNLETRYAGQRSLRGADVCRIVREC